MVNFTILLLLCLITESAGMLDGGIDINSNLKLKSIQSGGSTFSKKLRSLKDKRLQSWIVNNLLDAGDFNRLSAFNKLSGFKILCRTLLLKLTTKICKQFCYDGLCYNYCSQIRKICTI